MSDQPQPSLAWALAGLALAEAVDIFPLPPGVTTGRVGDWLIVANQSSLSAVELVGRASVELVAFEIYVRREDKIGVHGLLGPREGIIGGYPEEQFIEDMVKHISPLALEPFAAELAYRKESKH